MKAYTANLLYKKDSEKTIVIMSPLLYIYGVDIVDTTIQYPGVYPFPCQLSWNG